MVVIVATYRRVLTLILLMGTANSEEARFEASVRAKQSVREHMISGQSIRYGHEYTLTNICLSGVSISQ